MNELRRTPANFQVVGTVYEKSMLVQDNTGKWISRPLEIVNTERALYDDGADTGRKIKCKRLNGTVTLMVASHIMDFSVNLYSKKSNGEDNPLWEMAEGINNWVPQIGNREEGTRPSYVTMKGRLSNRDNVSKRDGKVYSRLVWNVQSECHEVDRSIPEYCTLDAVLYVQGYQHEMRNEEETGRIIMNLLGVDDRGGCYPVRVFVQEDMAEIEDAIEVGSTVPVNIDRVMVEFGRKKGKTLFAAKGRTQHNVSSGFTREELQLVSIEEPIEEPEEEYTEDENGKQIPVRTLWINPDVMRKAIRERAVKLKELEEGGGKKPAPTKSSKPTKPTVKRKPAPEPDFDDAPFDKEDEDDFDDEDF